jgi:putative transposon-encoded protein
MTIEVKKTGENYSRRKVKIILYGKEAVTKKVTVYGNNGRVSLPSSWIGARIKVIKL